MTYFLIPIVFLRWWMLGTHFDLHLIINVI